MIKRLVLVIILVPVLILTSCKVQNTFAETDSSYEEPIEETVLEETVVETEEQETELETVAKKDVELSERDIIKAASDNFNNLNEFTISSVYDFGITLDTVLGEAEYSALVRTNTEYRKEPLHIASDSYVKTVSFNDISTNQESIDIRINNSGDLIERRSVNGVSQTNIIDESTIKSYLCDVDDILKYSTEYTFRDEKETINNEEMTVIDCKISAGLFGDVLSILGIETDDTYFSATIYINQDNMPTRVTVKAPDGIAEMYEKTTNTDNSLSSHLSISIDISV